MQRREAVSGFQIAVLRVGNWKLRMCRWVGKALQEEAGGSLSRNHGNRRGCLSCQVERGRNCKLRTANWPDAVAGAAQPSSLVAVQQGRASPCPRLTVVPCGGCLRGGSLFRRNRATWLAQLLRSADFSPQRVANTQRVGLHLERRKHADPRSEWAARECAEHRVLAGCCGLKSALHRLQRPPQPAQRLRLPLFR